jgi:hypothetical protein
MKRDVTAWIQWAAMLVLVSLLPGCQTIGGLYAIFIDPLIPPKVIPAEHDMSDKKVLVWVDNPQMNSQYALFRRTLTEALKEELLEHQGAAQVVSYEKIARFHATYPDDSLEIEALRQKFQADQVLYVLVNDFSWEHDAGVGFYQPRINGYIKVVDAQEGGFRLWPDDRTHQTFQYKGRIAQGVGNSFEKKLLKAFNLMVANDLAQYFHEHTPQKP